MDLRTAAAPAPRPSARCRQPTGRDRDRLFAELVYGAEKSAKPAETLAEVERFAARLAVLAFDDRAAAHAANIRATSERRGAPIGAYDLLIAGHARSLGLVVVTGNLREFDRVEGLRAEDWLV